MPYVHTLALTLAIASGSAHAMSDAALADIRIAEPPPRRICARL